jgi:hypothetical protein
MPLKTETPRLRCGVRQSSGALRLKLKLQLEGWSGAPDADRACVLDCGGYDAAFDTKAPQIKKPNSASFYPLSQIKPN